MFNRKFLYIGLLLLSANLAYGSMKEDIAFLNELYKQERYDMALSESQRFIENYPDSKYNKNICERMAKVHFIKKEYKQAEKYFNLLLTDYKLKKDEKTEVYSYLYRINTLNGNSAKAAEFAESFKENSRVYEKTLYESGVILLNNGKNSEAVKEFLNAAKFNGEYSEPAVLYAAMGLYNNGQYGEALKYLDYYNNLQSTTKDIPLLTYLYGASYYKLNELNKGIGYLEKNLTDYPKDIYSRKGKITLIEIYANRGEIDKALTLYSSIEETENKKAGARVLADYFLAKEEYKRAVSFYDVYGENKPDNVRYTYAYAFYKLGNYNKAVQEFSKINDKKYITDSRYYIIVSTYNLKDYKKTAEYEKYLSNYETDAKKHTDLSVIFANSFYELENYKKSYDYYKNIYKDYPAEDNLYRVIVLETKIPENPETEKNIETLFAEYKTKFPQDTAYKKDIYLAVGGHYYKSGQTEKAEAVYKEYMQTGKDLEIGNNLVNLLINEKKYTEVIHYLNMMEENNDSTYLKGIAYMGVGEYEKAHSYLSSLENKDGVSKELKEKTQYNIIKNNFLWEKYDLVIKEGEEYLQSTYIYGLDDIVDRIGLSYYRTGKFEKAREYFSKLEVIPEYKGYARFQTADSYFAEKNYEKARDAYKLVYSDKYGKKYEEDAKYWELNSELNLDNKEGYLKGSEAFIKSFPNSAYIRNILSVRGTLLAAAGEEEKAVKEYETLFEKSEQAVEKDQTVEKILELYDKTENIEAKSLWIEKFSDKYKKSYYKSLAYREKNMSAEAREEEKILLESPLYKDYALANLGNDSFNEQKYDEAEKNYKAIKDMDSSSYKDLAVYQLGNIYALKGQNVKAETELSRVFVLYPDSIYALPAQVKLAEVYEAQGHSDKAENIYKELLNNKKAEEYKEFLNEKMLYLSLKKNNKTEAEIYYKNLQKLNPETAGKYDEFMLEEKQEETKTKEEQ